MLSLYNHHCRLARRNCLCGSHSSWPRLTATMHPVAPTPHVEWLSNINHLRFTNLMIWVALVEGQGPPALCSRIAA